MSMAMLFESHAGFVSQVVWREYADRTVYVLHQQDKRPNETIARLRPNDAGCIIEVAHANRWVRFAAYSDYESGLTELRRRYFPQLAPLPHLVA